MPRPWCRPPPALGTWDNPIIVSDSLAQPWLSAVYNAFQAAYSPIKCAQERNRVQVFR